MWVAGTVGLALIVLVMTAVIAWKIRNPAFAGQGQLFLGMPLALFWLWLLRTMPIRWRQTEADLAAETVKFVEGSVHCRFKLTVGLIQMARYYLQAEAITFHISEDVYSQFRNGGRYRIYYAPHSQTFLGGLPLVQPVPSVSANDHAPARLLEPLTARELEILQLIAAGLSNQQIADQLFLSVNTIKMYASQVYQKLGVKRRAEAVAQARDLNILT